MSIIEPGSTDYIIGAVVVFSLAYGFCIYGAAVDWSQGEEIGYFGFPWLVAGFFVSVILAAIWPLASVAALVFALSLGIAWVLKELIKRRREGSRS